MARRNIRREKVVSVGAVDGQLDGRVVLVVVDGRTGGLAAAVHVLRVVLVHGQADVLVLVVVVHRHAVSEWRLSGRLQRGGRR